jgi:hypothetical protein
MRWFYSLTLALLLATGVWLSSLIYAYYGNDDRQDIYDSPEKTWKTRIASSLYFITLESMTFGMEHRRF